ncbi:hypothetical protein [Paenibacillus sp. V4I3]|uniref:hypothetical protein n=1 Tax=Paenibacillus sp. V4I3 TaxID=3042305 RepID=UPI003593B1A4
MAEQIGYQPSYFIRLFRKHEDMTPVSIGRKNYMKKWRYQQVNDSTDMSTPNIPPVPTSPTLTSTSPVSGRKHERSFKK